MGSKKKQEHILRHCEKPGYWILPQGVQDEGQGARSEAELVEKEEGNNRRRDGGGGSRTVSVW